MSENVIGIDVTNERDAKMSRKIYSLRILQGLDINHEDSVLRVPGGWIFATRAPSGVSSVFIPYNDEFLDIAKHGGKNAGSTAKT